MSISFFVARTQLSDQHKQVGNFWIRTRQDDHEQPGMAATKSHDRLMPGETFLNAIPETPPKV